MEDKILKELGWWIAVTPLSRLKPEEWICGIYKRGKKSWITEACKSEFEDPYSARYWAIEWIKAIDSNVKVQCDEDLFWTNFNIETINKKEQEDAKKKNN